MEIALFGDRDPFADEFAEFQRDVYILINNGLLASIAGVDLEADKESAKLDEWRSWPNADQDRIVEKDIEISSDRTDQVTFLRNLALVALSSRLTYALRRMADLSSSPLGGPYGSRENSEYQKLWNEYRDRFGINVTIRTNRERIKFVEPMRRVRNQIVHKGGLANKFNERPPSNGHGNSLDGEQMVRNLVDTRFSDEYPEYVTGTGLDARVSVSMDQLEKMIEEAIELVRWLAGELHTYEGLISTPTSTIN